MDPLLDWLLRAGLASLFLSAAFHKARDRAAFASTLGDYKLLPAWSSATFVPVLIAVEAALAMALLVPDFRVHAGASAVALLSVYSAAIAVNLARGRREIDCGCLGPGYRQSLSGWLLARNAVLGGAALLLTVRISPRPLAAIDAMSFALGLGVLFLLFVAANQLLAQAPRVQALRRSS